MEEEPQRLQVVDRRLDREGQRHPLRGQARPERIGLLAPGPGVQQLALRPEPGHERRARDRRHLADAGQAEAGESGTDLGVATQQGRGEWREEIGLTARLDRGEGRCRWCQISPGVMVRPAIAPFRTTPNGTYPRW